MATDTKEKGQPPTAHAERVDPAAPPPAGASALREVQREMQQLQERVEQLTQNAAPAAPTPPPAPPPAVYSDPDRGPSTPPPHPLQDILPQIKDLAQRVGGMKKLAEIVTTLTETKE